MLEVAPLYAKGGLGDGWMEWMEWIPLRLLRLLEHFAVLTIIVSIAGCVV